MKLSGAHGIMLGELFRLRVPVIVAPRSQGGMPSLPGIPSNGGVLLNKLYVPGRAPVTVTLMIRGMVSTVKMRAVVSRHALKTVLSALSLGYHAERNRKEAAMTTGAHSRLGPL
eukprot:1351949-Amorphochlora_amoeboformis.AAC.2